MEQEFEVIISSQIKIHPADIYRALQKFFSRQEIGISVYESALRAERDELREALDLLIGIGRKDHSNEKYDSIYENAIIVLEKYK